MAQVDEMIEKVGGNDADANLRLQAVIKLLESRKVSVDLEVGTIGICILCIQY